MGTAWQYSGDPEKEYLAIRTKAGLMDVSGLKKVHLNGPAATHIIDRATTRNAEKIMPGRSVYATMLNDAGKFIDDCVIYRTGPNSWMVVHGSGGIGITPFLSQIKQLRAMGGNFELHYGVRTQSLASYADELRADHGGRVHVYHADRREAIDLERLLDGQPLGTHLYVCGPKGMIGWVRDTATRLGWPRQAVHHEEFLAPASGQPFEATLARSNKVIRVDEHQSLLEAIEAAGVDAPYLCRGGACGQCETDVIEYDGVFVHRDHWLTDEQRGSCAKIMPCVSRFEGRKLVLDR